jgi:radical SAM protein with 4Fe4S-binding SPASM domain
MGLPKEFRSVGWGITRRCNLSCPHCYSSATKSAKDELSTDECRRLIDFMPALGVESIGWTGGEPLLRKDLEDLISYARDYGIDSGITTNGIPLTRKRVESIKEAGLNSLQISLDGSTPERNRAIRGARLEDFPLIIDGVKMCLEAELPVHLAMILARDTVNDVMDYINMARDLGVKSIRFCGFVPHGGATDEAVRRRLEFADRQGELVELVEKLMELDSPGIILDPAHGPLPPGYSFHRCIAGVGTFYISDNGDLYPCTGLLDERFRVGNVRQQLLPDLIEKPRMAEMASFNHDKIHGHCRECAYFRVCRGACRGAVYAHTGDLNASFPVCLYRTGIESS